MDTWWPANSLPITSLLVFFNKALHFRGNQEWYDKKQHRYSKKMSQQPLWTAPDDLFSFPSVTGKFCCLIKQDAVKNLSSNGVLCLWQEFPANFGTPRCLGTGHLRFSAMEQGSWYTSICRDGNE